MDGSISLGQDRVAVPAGIGAAAKLSAGRERELPGPRSIRGAAVGQALKARGVTPSEPEELREHNCLGYTSPPERWTFSGGRTIAVNGNLNIDNGDALRSVALDGHGIVYLPTFLVGEDLRAGRLVVLLADHVDLEGGAFAAYPESRHLSPKVRALIDYLVACLGAEPEWDAFLSEGA